MKHIIYCFLTITLIYGCTSYDEDLRINIQDYQTLTPENIETNLKVANIVVDPGEYDEMYTNYTEDIDIKGELNLYKNGITLIENEAIEVNIKGHFSSSFALKTLGIKFDDTYNNTERKLIDAEHLSFHSIDKIKSFRFRNSGNDFRHTMLKDMSYTKLAIDAQLNLDVMYAEQTIVFVNGKFFGLMNLRTESNANGISRLYGVKKSSVTLAKIINPGILEKKDGDFDRIDNFIAAIEKEDYNYLSQEIDIANFIDYMIFQSYIDDGDWPQNNVRFFALDDGPFRFFLFDLDLVCLNNIDNSPLTVINNPIKNPITDLFNIMYANEEFKQTYDTRFQSLMNSSLLSSSRFNAIVTEYKNNIELMMPAQVEKYNIPNTFTEWYLEIEHLKDNFKTREDYVK